MLTEKEKNELAELGKIKVCNISTTQLARYFQLLDKRSKE